MLPIPSYSGPLDGIGIGHVDLSVNELDGIDRGARIQVHESSPDINLTVIVRVWQKTTVGRGQQALQGDTAGWGIVDQGQRLVVGRLVATVKGALAVATTIGK